MLEAIDEGTLSTVRRELDAVLKQARGLLEEYAENPGDPDLLRRCATELHQLHGPLQMIEVHGAVLLAREMEQVIDALLREIPEQPAVALELIMQALLQLPDYLSGLQSGKRDNPGLLIPLVNSLRSVRSAQPLGEITVFYPDITVPMPVSVFVGESASVNEDSRSVARDERRRFQAGLLEWFRAGSSSAGLQTLFEVLVRLQESAVLEPVARLWWIAAGVAEALFAGVLEETPEIKRLLGQLDRQIKYLSDMGESAVAERLSDELLRGLLYQLACAGACKGRIDTIKATYKLAEYNPSDADKDVQEARLRGYGEDLLQAVSVNLSESISRIKGQLNDIRQEEHNDPATLTSLANAMHELGNSLNMAGMGALGTRLAQQEQLISAAAGAGSAVTGDSLAELASTLTAMEEKLSVDDAGFSDSTMPDSPESDRECGEVSRDFVELMLLVKSALNDSARSPDDYYLLDPVPGFISRIQSGLQSMGQDRAAAVMEQLEEFISRDLIVRRITLTEEQLADLSDAISCIDNYVQESGGNRNPGVMMLEIAESSMARLGYPCQAMAESDPDYVPTEVVDSRPDPCSGAGAAHDLSNGDIEPGGRAGASAEPADPDDPGMKHSEVLQQDGAESSGRAEDALPVLSEDADPEIVEIYLEEAAEELDTLSKALPAWLGSPADMDGLEAIRRSFHTLKGSGRMAGAMLAGEFSWSVENLLNKVLEGSVAPELHVCELLGQVLDPLAQLIEQLGGGDTPDADIHGLMARAEALATGKYTGSTGELSGDTAEREPESRPEPESPPDSPPDSPPQPEHDPGLISIFTGESRELLQLIRDFLAADTANSVVTEPVYRALHTLTGISETADVMSIHLLASDLYGYFDDLYQSQVPLNAAVLDVLCECTQAIYELLDADPVRGFDADRLSVLRERVASLPAIEPEQQAVSNHADESGSRPEDAGAEPSAAAADNSAEAEVECMPVADHQDDGDPYADMDPELVEIFIEEASEILDSSENTLRDWTADPLNNDLQSEFQRQLHTLKGGARMVNISAIGDLSHALESLLTQVSDGHVETSDKLFALLVDVHDGLAGMLELVKKRRLPDAAADLLAALGRIGQDDEADSATTVICPEQEPVQESVPETESVPAAESQTGTVPASGKQPEAGSRSEEAPGESCAAVPDRAARNTVVTGKPVQERRAPRPEANRRTTSRVRGEQVRVPAGLLDDMVNLAGEITIFRSRIEQQVSDYHFNLNELEQTIGRLHDQLRQMEIETETQALFRFEQDAGDHHAEFDPLEMDRYSNLQQLSRSMIESISDLRSISGLMEGAIRESEVLLLQQSRVSTKLQDGLIRTRMIPFTELAPRLRRVLRQAAQALGKKADLALEGAEGEIDRTVVERIIAPLEHMLRNAVAHGIETPEQRRQAGKAETGTVTISMQREGSEIVLRIADDGAGVDLEAIRSRALERGLMADDAELSDNDIMQFILQTGFSTAGEVTQISGRGVGMDVVNSEVKQLGGSLEIDSACGNGTAVTVRLPYTLAINQALLVKAGDETFCIPLAGIEGVVNIEAAELIACYEAGGSFGYAGNSYRLQHLGTMLGTGGLEQGMAQGNYPVLFVRIGNKRMAMQADALMGSREIVIKPLGAQLSTVDGISGATILGDGRVVLILDLAAVSRMNMRLQPEETHTQDQSPGQLVAMVVDDSITVRKVTTRLLERRGFKVLAAKDGVDAMGQLQENVPDIVLLDVEMPRMDGFELATHIRNDVRLQKLPIIMITSRTGDKHRERARQIGVNNYLGKPYQENELLDSIYKLMGVSAEATAG